jgi:hypothetical protein
MNLLLFCFLFLLSNFVSSQSPNYISVRKKNGQAVKNFYTGSHIILQLKDRSYLAGPILDVRKDSVYVALYDIRRYPTTWGTYVNDTISKTVAALHYKEIWRISIFKRQDFIKRKSGPMLMIGSAGYLTLNILNGAFFDQPVTDAKNIGRIGTALGAFGVGFLFSKLFTRDGFSKKKHQIVYVDL